jgi:hypothetical protein
MKPALLALLAVLFLASPAHAWNCSDPLAARVPVPAGTTGSYGDGDGQLFLGTGTEGVKGQLAGHTMRCQMEKGHHLRSEHSFSIDWEHDQSDQK